MDENPVYYAPLRHFEDKFLLFNNLEALSYAMTRGPLKPITREGPYDSAATDYPLQPKQTSASPLLNGSGL